MPKVWCALLSLIVAATALPVGADETGVDRSDAAITTRARAALRQNSDTRAGQIQVETRDGVVHLSGFVESEPIKRVAENIVLTVGGVRQVRNDLVVRIGAERPPDASTGGSEAQ